MDSRPAFPMQEQRIDLASGRTITLLNLIIFVAGDGRRRLDVQYRTTIPQEREAERLAEATELLALYSPFAATQGIRAATAQLCNSKAAAATRELAEQIYLFEAPTGGEWAFTGRGI